MRQESVEGQPCGDDRMSTQGLHGKHALVAQQHQPGMQEGIPGSSIIGIGEQLHEVGHPQAVGLFKDAPAGKPCEDSGA